MRNGSSETTQTRRSTELSWSVHQMFDFRWHLSWWLFRRRTLHVSIFRIYDFVYKANWATLNRFAITILSEELSKGFSQRIGSCIETVLQSGAFSPSKTITIFWYWPFNSLVLRKREQHVWRWRPGGLSHPTAMAVLCIFQTCFETYQLFRVSVGYFCLGSL